MSFWSFNFFHVSKKIEVRIFEVCANAIQIDKAIVQVSDDVFQKIILTTKRKPSKKLA